MTRLARALTVAAAVLSSASGASLILNVPDVPLEVGAPLHLDCGVHGHPRYCFWETEDGRVFQVEDVHGGRHAGLWATHNLTNNQCGIVVEQGGARDAGAWTCRVFLQGEALSTVRNVVPKHSRACQAPFVAVGSGCFYFSETLNASWDDARAVCKTLSAEGDLAVVDDCKQMQLIWDHIVLNYGESDNWIGGKDRYHTGVWLWVDATPITMGTPFWGPAEPNNWQGSEDCVELTDDSHGYFNDEDCGDKNHFVCQDRSPHAL